MCQREPHVDRAFPPTTTMFGEDARVQMRTLFVLSLAKIARATSECGQDFARALFRLLVPKRVLGAVFFK